ncbi:MAG: TIGR00730 family Rossman fold protein [Stagnimonas sp.]|nr:TIGR00730 family Rossman fold protein [Stagnimonas sp.]
MKLIKAYNNTDFLNSEDARTVRILCEYLEPLARLRREGVSRAIVAFGSARLRPQTADATERDWFRQAAELGERLARWTCEQHPHDQRYHLVTGGGPGIMEAFHEGGAKVDRSLNIGMGISLPHEQHGNPHLNARLGFEFHYFFMRKFWFMNLAKAFVVFPGGFGTLDELFEALTLMQVGKAVRMPLVLFGREYWDELLNLPALARRGLISPDDLKLLHLVDSVDDAFERITTELSTG